MELAAIYAVRSDGVTAQNKHYSGHHKAKEEQGDQKNTWERDPMNLMKDKLDSRYQVHLEATEQDIIWIEINGQWPTGSITSVKAKISY